MSNRRPVVTKLKTGGNLAQAEPANSLNSPASLLGDRLNQLSRDIPEQVRRAAAYATANPRETAFCTIRQFSEHAGVSPASTLRMARLFGFTGFTDFRETYRTLLKNTPGSPVLVGKNRAATDALLSCVCSVPTVDLQAFNARLNLVADQVLAAQNVFVVGFRSAHAFAQYFAYHAHMIMPKFHLASPAMSSVAEHLASATRDDLVIVFSMAPYATEAVQLAHFLADNTIPTVAVTDDADSAFAARCDHVLETTRPSVGHINSMVGCVTMSEALLSRCFEKMGTGAREKIEEFERRIRRLRGYWPPR
jgi:DNA-binding MurR/RpiR family transcriptional regulator